MSTKLKIIILLLFLVQGAVFYWTYSDKEQVEKERLKPFQTYLKNPLAVKTLELSNLKLEELPIDFSQFQNLEYLDLSNNQFEKIPEKLFDLPKLSVLIMSNNKLSIINNLPPTMNRLILDNNQIENISFQEISTTKLKYINLSNNRLSYIPNMQKIQIDTIILSNNQLEDINSSLANFPSKHVISHLDLSENYNLYYSGNSKNGLPFICKSLDFTNINSIDFPRDLFQKGSILSKLFLTNNFYTSIYILPTNNLGVLDFSNTSLSFSDPKPFKHCDSLKRLSLSGYHYGLDSLKMNLEELSINLTNKIILDLPKLRKIRMNAHTARYLINSKNNLISLDTIILRNSSSVDFKINLQNDFPETEIILSDDIKW